MRTGKASRTASQNALFRALETRRPAGERVADDPLAVQFLPFEFRLVAELSRLAPLRGLAERVIDRRWPCVRPGVVVRTRLIDQVVAAELAGMDQLLILGAGLDTRAYRLTDAKTIRVFEVDHPATQAAKKRVLARRRQLLPGVRFVPVVFGTDDLAAQLLGSGFRFDVKTLVLWEGVTNYLDAAAVDGTFRFLESALGSGSPVLFTYVDRRMLEGSVVFEGAQTTMHAVQQVGEPFTFGFVPTELRGYLADRNFELLSDVAISEEAPRFYRAGHCPKAPAYYHLAGLRRI